MPGNAPPRRSFGRCGFPLTVNVVLHRANIARIERIIALAEEVGAARLELANTQFYGWAFQKQACPAAHPRPASAGGAGRDGSPCASARENGDSVRPARLLRRSPKPCMNGWGRRYLTVNPVGDVLPCPTASAIPSLQFDNVRQHPLRWIWAELERSIGFAASPGCPNPAAL